MIVRSAKSVACVLALLAPVAGCAASAGESPSSPDEPAGSAREALSVAAPDAAAAPPSLAIPPIGVPDADGQVALVVGATQAVPLIFRAASSAVRAIDSGFEVNGDISFDTPAGPLTLANASLTFTWAADRSNGLESLLGTVDLPAPGLGALSDFGGLDAPLRATLGYARGAELKGRVDAPMQDDRRYLAFDYATGFSASAGPISVAAPGSRSGTLIIDPTDPSFYMTGGLLGLDEVGPLSDMGLGLSARGLVPFTPQTTWGVEDRAHTISGHLYAKGTVTLERIPVSIDGELIVNVDPTGAGQRLGASMPDGVELGANGTLNFTVDLLHFATFSTPLGHATLGARIVGTQATAYLSGNIDPDTNWSVLPFQPASSLKAAAYIDPALTGSYFTAQGDYALKASKLYNLVGDVAGFSLSDISLASATLRAGADGLRVDGVAQTPPTGAFAPRGQLVVSVVIPQQPENFTMDLRGDMSVFTFPLGAAQAHIDRSRAAVNGTFVTPISQVAITGEATGSGGTLRGNVAFHVHGPHGVLQTVTDGAVCGYETIRDAAICGTHTVTDAAQCGTHAVTDAAICGTQVITDAAQCGTHTVTSAAICGTHTVTDGAICGWDILSHSLECVLSGFKKSKCRKPKSCHIANSCDVASSCSVANTCSIASTCSVASTCDRAKTCTTTVNVPDFDFGEFRGMLSVAASPGGVSGQVDGSICSGGTCTGLPSGRVELTASPRACLTGVPGLSGETCVAF